MQRFFSDSVKLIEYIASDVNVVLSNPCVDSLRRTRISFLLLLVCTDKLISTPKIITFLSSLPSVYENSERESNPMP